MGAAASSAASSRPVAPAASPPSSQSSPPHPAAAIAVRGQPPPPGTRPSGGLLGFFSSRPSRSHLETTITSLAADLSAAKARVASVERDLQDAIAEAHNQGVPRTECVVCMAASVSTVLMPCGHLCLCMTCASSMQQKAKSVACPLCRVHVDKVQRVFLPVEPSPRPPTLPPSSAQDEEPDSPLSSASTAAADAGVQVSPSLRRPAAAALRAPALHPVPRLIIKRPERIAALYDDDIIRRPAAAMARSPPERADAPPADVPEVRGSPEERPGAYDFVLPGAYVPSSNQFAATWDGALRVRE